MKKQHLLLSALASLLLSVPALADSVTLSLASASQTGAPGSTLSYVATVSAPNTNTGNIYLNGDGFNLVGPATLQDTPFFSNFPEFLAKGTSVSDVLFTLDVFPNAAPGMYNGTFTLFGGPGAGAYNDLGTVNFAFTVPSAVPEPATWLLLSTGLTGGIAAFRLRRRAA